MSLNQFLNPVLANLPVYQPGRPIEEVARQLNLPADGIIKLASNENPLGPSPAALEAMRRAISQVHLYPDGNAFYLKNKLAAQLDLTPQNLILGNGSNEIIEFVGHAFLQPGLDVVVSQYCFAVYPIVAHLFGANLVTVPARDYGHDLDAMLNALTPQSRILFVANPNNPTGTCSGGKAVRRLIDAIPHDVLLVMDEAYIEYLQNPIDLLHIVRDGSHPNLLLMRTFSKIHGLAGLRVGYGIGHPDLIAALEKIRQPFNINAVAQAAALAALDDVAHVTQTRANNAIGLALFENGFLKLGLNYVPSSANFTLVHVGNGQQVFESLQRQGIITRPMAGYQLPEWLRISVGTPEENRRCLDALRTVLQPRDSRTAPPRA
jgi:histidinol-phosphate aminotransferase